MVPFVDWSSLASILKLLGLVMNIPNCGCIEVPPKSLTFATQKMEQYVPPVHLLTA
jgi:hypothetical protein